MSKKMLDEMEQLLSEGMSASRVITYLMMKGKRIHTVTDVRNKLGLGKTAAVNVYSDVIDRIHKEQELSKIKQD